MTKQLKNECFPFDQQDLEEELEELASKVIMTRIILESIIPAFISFLIGPWSDKFGRKPILVGTFFGWYFYFLIIKHCIGLTISLFFSLS